MSKIELLQAEISKLIEERNANNASNQVQIDRLLYELRQLINGKESK